MLDYHEIAKKVSQFLAHCKNEKELAAVRAAFNDAIREGAGVYQTQFPEPIGRVVGLEGLDGGTRSQEDPLAQFQYFDRMAIDKEGVTLTHMGEIKFVPHSVFMQFTVQLTGPKPE